MVQAKDTNTSTPWGRADTSYSLTRGVTWYNTPGHGGLGVAPGWAKQNLSPQAQALGERLYGKLWYEEDCQCDLVFFEHPALILPIQSSNRTEQDVLDHAEKSIRAYYPQYFDPEFQARCAGGALPPTPQVNSLIRLDSNPATYGVTGTSKNGYMVRNTKTGVPYFVKSTLIFESCCYMKTGEVEWQDPNSSNE